MVGKWTPGLRTLAIGPAHKDYFPIKVGGRAIGPAVTGGCIAYAVRVDTSKHTRRLSQSIFTHFDVLVPSAGVANSDGGEEAVCTRFQRYQSHERMLLGHARTHFQVGSDWRLVRYVQLHIK